MYATIYSGIFSGSFAYIKCKVYTVYIHFGRELAFKAFSQNSNMIILQQYQMRIYVYVYAQCMWDVAIYKCKEPNTQTN